ncbi:hypothetical protein [Nonomuraea guangzhouensis]|uniref:Uncharacterized protein n=1 Tax=Nonomuraea guangzhouensis TaxID=1291555 RepID=A0ABW4GEM7_9ACTN|nr:hypothetical protein [Nonomuraea guangzhouensis]
MTLHIKKMAAGLCTAFALMAGGIASTAPASAESTADLALAVSCSNSAAPGGSFLEATYSQPNACLKCRASGEVYEATGNYRAYCKNVRDGSSVVAVQLWLFCVVCRNEEAAAGAL